MGGVVSSHAMPGGLKHLEGALLSGDFLGEFLTQGSTTNGLGRSNGHGRICS